MKVDSDRGAVYLRAADGRRTRLYTSEEGARRAAERGEWYTDAAAATGSIPVVGAIGSSIPLTARW